MPISIHLNYFKINSTYYLSFIISAHPGRITQSAPCLFSVQAKTIFTATLNSIKNGFFVRISCTDRYRFTCRLLRHFAKENNGFSKISFRKNAEKFPALAAFSKRLKSRHICVNNLKLLNNNQKLSKIINKAVRPCKIRPYINLSLLPTRFYRVCPIYQLAD